MTSKIKIAAGALALAAVTAAPVALTTGTAHANSTRPTATATPTATRIATTVPTKRFGQTVTIDGFKITIKHQHDGKEGKIDARPGHYSELVQIYVKPTKTHEHWGLHWKQHARYGKHHQLKATIDDGEGFGKVNGTWYAWTRLGVGKNHCAKHLSYTFTFKGHRVHWVND